MVVSLFWLAISRPAPRLAMGGRLGRPRIGAMSAPFFVVSICNRHPALYFGGPGFTGGEPRWHTPAVS